MTDRRRTAVAVLPARYGSHRLPGKPLLNETGKYLIQHVCEEVRKAPLISRVIVATDDERIAQAVRRFGGEAVMTRADHRSGTDRVAEVAAGLDADLIVNVQGDEPDIDPAHIDLLVRQLDDAEMATLAAPFADPKEAGLPQRVKVAVDAEGFAARFSRTPLNGTSYLHLGIYGYTRDCLLRFASLPPTPAEQSEKLEQLRALDHGIRIKVGVVDRPGPGGIDTREDYEAFVRRKQNP